MKSRHREITSIYIFINILSAVIMLYMYISICCLPHEYLIVALYVVYYILKYVYVRSNVNVYTCALMSVFIRALLQCRSLYMRLMSVFICAL